MLLIIRSGLALAPKPKPNPKPNPNPNPNPSPNPKPNQESWVKPSGSMVQPDGSGNGFGWGQLSHLLGWVLFVGGLNVEEVT